LRARLLAALFLAAMPAAAAITGTVINDDGQPVAGAKVSAFALESSDEGRARMLSADPQRKPLATAETDAKGNFSIDVKQPVVQLRIEKAGLAPASERAANDDDAGVISIGSTAMKQGTISANGKPLAGATVIVSSAAGELVTTTDASGHYAVPDPAHSGSRITVRHPDYAPLQELVGPFSATKLDLAMTPGTPLTGRVVADDGQTPVANAIIELDALPLATTGSDGTFTIPHATLKSTTELTARQGSRIATRTLGKDRGNVTLRLAPAASVTGRLLDTKTQLPIAGAAVNVAVRRLDIFTNTNTAGAVTDAKGNYTIGGLAGGEYEITAQHPSYAIAAMSLNVPPGRSVQKALFAEPLARVSGTVVDDARQPVSGARVQARGVSSDGRPMMMSRSRMTARMQPGLSGPDGRFLLRVDNESDFQLDAAKRGLPAAHSTTLHVAAGERKTGVTITIPRGVALTGRVVDHNGKGIAGAGIAAAESRGGQGPGGVRRMVANMLGRGNDDLVRTAADGKFTMRLKEGSYDLAVTAPGYAPRTLRAQQVAANGQPIEITLEPGVEITGRLTRGGVPLEGVRVFPVGGDGGAPTETASDGSFRLADLSPGEMMLTFTKPEDFVQLIRPVTAPARDVNIDLPAGGRISGHVVDKATHAPVKSFDAGISMSRPGGAGMAIAMPPVMHSVTSDDGSFTLENVPTGNLTVVVTAPGYVAARIAGVTVENGKTVDNLEVPMETGVRVSGHVTGPGGAPVGGAVVRVQPPSGGPRGMRMPMDQTYTTTDPNGEYTLDNVEPGETTIAFTRSGLLPVEKSVTLSGQSMQVDAQLGSGMSISGVVLSDAGAPLADANVHASSAADAGGGKTTRTDANGAFTIDGVSPGHYEIVAQKTGFADAQLHDVDITTSGPLRILMHGGGIITGHVTGLSPTELQNATVHAYSAAGNASAPVDASGAYRLEGAPLGTVRVSAQAGQFLTGRAAPTQSVQIDPGTTVNVDFDFASDITVTGRVTRNGAPVPGAIVAFTPRGPSMRSARGPADNNGVYSITGLDNGTYSVMAAEPGHAAWTGSYTVSGSGTFDIDMHGTSVTGRVLDATTNAPLTDAVIEMRPMAGTTGMTVRASTDATGGFTFEQVAAGTYDVTAQKTSYGAATTSVVVADNGTAPVELKLNPSQGLVLHVVDARDQRPLTAWATAVGDDGREYTGGSASGIPGPLTLSVNPGHYTVTVGASYYASQTISVNAPGEQTVAITPGGTIVVTYSGSAPALVQILDAAGQAYRRGRGFGSGAMALTAGDNPFPNVPAGPHVVQLLDAKRTVLGSQQVTVADGQTVSVRF
jgi:protocatechuate 3,4-dioxygenase beta subunit